MRKSKLLEDCLQWYRQSFQEGFIIVSETEIDSDMIYRLYYRETLQLAVLWKNIVDSLADQADIARGYGYGFVIAENTIARCQEGFLLLNSEVFNDLDWHETSLKMLVAAAEELAHYSGYTYHNESFKCRYADLLEIALKERVQVNDLVVSIKKVKKYIEM